MAFGAQSKKTGRTFYLHSKEVILKGGRKQRIFYFSGNVGEGAIDALPSGYMIGENSKTGLPILKKAV